MNCAVPQDMVAVGEVGLAGEVRAVSRIESRLGEARKLGFTRAMVPRGNAEAAQAIMPNVHPVMRLTEGVGILRPGVRGR
jgi:DNA repair protein RadA/Sms